MTRSSSLGRPLNRRGHADGSPTPVPTRRTFLRLLALGAAAFASSRPATASAGLPRSQTLHPEPRPGVDGSRVLTAEQLADAPELIELYDAIREIPHIVDGIHCYCGCAPLEGFRSLLSCYETSGMPMHCDICRDQGRLAVNRAKEGQSLAQIRRATDARFGTGSAAPAAPHGRKARRRAAADIAATAAP
jgi:Protein of unknown function with PCYCGC motif